MIKLVCYYGLGVEATSVPQASRRDSDSEVVLSRLSVKGWAPGDPCSRPATRPRAGWTLLSHREKEENPKERPRPQGPSPVALPPALPPPVSDMHRNSIGTPLVTRLPPSGHRWSLTFLAVIKAEEPTEA